MTHKSLLLLLLALLLCTASYANLHDTANRADYLIITPQNVIQSNAWIPQLADWRNQHGRTAMLVPSDSIWTEFGNGTPSDTTLKAFLFYAYDHWSAPQLRDVFIIGWHDLVPSHIDSSFWEEPALSDYYFAVRDSSQYGLPLISIGRLPWSPSQTPQLYNYYNKIVAYETQPPAPWQRRVHLIADSTEQSFAFAEASDASVEGLDSSVTILRNYVDYPQGDPRHGDSTLFMRNWNDGSLVVAPFSRADFGTWGYGLHLTPDNLGTLSNGSRLPIVLGIEEDVSLSSFLLSGIPAVLLSNPNGGAIGYFGVSNYCFVGTTVSYRLGLLQVATADSQRVLGDVWRMASIYLLPSMQAEWVMLFGDPGLRLPAMHAAAIPEPTAVPHETRLIGNYPNPFNPSTQIEFELKQTARVKLEVMNILGQHMDTLIDGPQAAGSHSISWNGANHPSGLYFVVLQSGNIREVKKMMLLK